MRYYKVIKNKKIVALGTGADGTEITKAEYDRLLSEIREKADVVNRVYAGEITIDSVKTEWKSEITKRVEDRKKADEFANSDEAEISDLEAMEIIMGVK